MKVNHWVQIPNELYISSHALIYYKKVLYNIYGETGDVDATSSREPCDTIFTYDLINDEENEYELNNAPIERRNHTCTKIGSKFILHGGDDCGYQVFRNDTYIFDLEKISWKKLNTKNLPKARRYHAATFLNHLFYIFGGEDEENFLNDLDCLDLDTLEWKSIKVEGYVPDARRYSTMVGIENKIYLFGGRNENFRMNDLNVYDSSKNIWKELTPTGDIPLPRAAQTMCAFKKSFFIFGGNNGASCNELYEYNTMSNHWIKISTKGMVPKARFWHASDIDQEEGVLYISGGFNEKDLTLDDCFMIKLGDPISERCIQNSVYHSNFRNYHDIEFKYII